MAENVILVLIGIGAAAFLVRHFSSRGKSESGCGKGCGCSKKPH